MLRRAYHSAAELRVALMKKLLPPRPDHLLINLGGGRWYVPRWENVDFYQAGSWVDHRVDFRVQARLPFADGCADAVFSSHLIEHITDAALQNLLAETHRILRPGGTVRITTPDAEAAMRAYHRGDVDFFATGGVKTRGDSIERRLVNYFASYRAEDYSGGPIVADEEVQEKVRTLPLYEFIGWCVEQIPKDAPYRAHINGHTFEKLERMLRDAAFTNIVRSSFRGSRLAEMRGPRFDNRPRVSLFVEATR